MNWAGLNTLIALLGRPLAMSALQANALFGLITRAGDPAYADSIRMRTRHVIDANFRPFVEEALGAPIGPGNQKLVPGRVVQVGSTAIVPVIGPLAADESTVTDSGGERFGTTFDEIRSGVELARGSAMCSEILLYVDSPGGEAIPSYPLVDFLLSMRDGNKPLGAFVARLAGSAALHIATACTRGNLVLTRAALMDSIGTMGFFVEESKRLAADGITVNLIMSDTKHAAGNSLLPMTQGERDRLQAEVSDLGNKFVSDVARARGVSVDRVREWAAKSWIGQAAVDGGLADAVVADLNAAVVRLSSKSNKKGPANMDTKTDTGTPASTPAANTVASIPTTVANAASSGGATAATIDQIKAICGGDKAFAFDMLEKNATIDQVREAWIAKLTADNAALQAQVQSGKTRLDAVASLGAPAIQAKPAAAVSTAGAASDGRALTDGDPGEGVEAGKRCEAIVAHLLANGTCKSRGTAMNHLIKNHAATYRAAKDGGWGERRAQSVLKPLGLI